MIINVGVDSSYTFRSRSESPTPELRLIKSKLDDDPDVCVFCHPSFFLSALALLQCDPSRVRTHTFLERHAIYAMRGKRA